MYVEENEPVISEVKQLNEKKSIHTNKKMTLDKLYDELLKMVPLEKCGKTDFLEYLQKKLHDYRNLLDNVDEAQQLVGWKQIVKNVDDLLEIIVPSIKHIFEGQHGIAFKLFSKRVIDCGFLSLHIKEKQSFYRMRTFEDKRKANYKELFHIPFSKRGKVSTQRFSVPGFPCLYLSESIYGCWEEMGRPSFDSCMVSRLENTRGFYVVDLRMPQKKYWMQKNLFQRQNYIFNMLSKFPLVLSCMVRVNDERASFKPEYIIPQLLLETYNWIGHKTPKDGNYIFGILYTSVQKNKDFEFPDRVFDNYAIPVISQEGEYCKTLCELFHITDPTCDEYERLKESYGPFWQYNPDDGISREEYNYEISAFGCMEERLKDANRFPLKIINYLNKNED